MRQKIKQPGLPFWGFGLRLAFAYGVIFALVFSVVCFYLIHNLEKQSLDQLRESLFQEARLVSPRLSDLELEPSRQRLIQQRVKELSQETRSRITVIAANGIVLGDSLKSWEELSMMDNHADRPEVRDALDGRGSSSIRFSESLNLKMLYVAIPMTRENKTEGALRLALSLGQVESILSSVERPVIFGTLAGILAASFFSVLLGQSMGRRISEISSVARRYAEGDLSKKIVVKGDDEIRLLAHSLNQMAHALKKRITETETEKRKLMLVLENMEEGVIAVNLEREILLANASAEKMFQVPQGSAVGKSLLLITKKTQIDEVMKLAMDEEEKLQQEIEIVRSEVKVLRGYFVGMKSEPEDICGIMVFSDMTQIRRLENLRREFVANVSHELRTPLTSIRGFIETLLQGAMEDPAVSQRFLKMMEEDALRLERLIADLMELSKLEAKQAVLEKQSLHLSEEVSHVAESLGPLLAEKKITFSNLIAKNSVPAVFADRDRLRQVLVNLFDNAIKFNKPGGEIKVSAELEKDSVRFLIRDTGSGIPQDAIERVFERFYRVEKARSRDLGGTGLGLSIVKHIIETHGGRVGCESQPGQGSTFFFTLQIFSNK